jgi:hypothetical protein
MGDRDLDSSSIVGRRTTDAMSGELEMVSIWLGCFPSEQRLEQYLTEHYGEDDAEPISEFAADQGGVFYDHDFMETGFRAATSARQLLRGHSFSKSYLSHVEAAWRSHGLANVNTLVLVWNREIESPSSVKKLDFELVYLGTFPCDTGAGEVDVAGDEASPRR